MNEFDLIEKYFLPLTQNRAEALGLKDDAALLQIPPECELVITTDTLNEGVHFLPQTAPGDLAHKALRVNLSDLAAMGAKPYAYQLALSLPCADEKFLGAFTAALLEDQNAYGIFCCGGDTTRGPLSVTITALGLVPKGKAIKRSGAKPGDRLIITGPVGDAWIGLRILQKKISLADPEYFLNAYHKPVPALAAAPAMQMYAHAAIDISDGLLADSGHMAAASGCGVEVVLADVKFSSVAQGLLKEGVVDALDLLTGGDDYVLALAAAAMHSDALIEMLCTSGFAAQTIGHFSTEPGLRLTDAQGMNLSASRTGYKHF